MAQKVIILTEAEYEELRSEIARWRNRTNELVWDIGSWMSEVDYWKDKYNKLYRLPIEESAEEGKAELLDWCAEVAERYEKLDEAEWMEEQARFYNNGLDVYAKMYHLPRDKEIVEEDRKYRNLPFPIWEPAKNGWDDAWIKYDCKCLGNYAPYHMIYRILHEYYEEWDEAWEAKNFERANKIEHKQQTYEVLLEREA